MSITTLLMLLAIGVVAGIMSSVVGIGGGIVIVPALMFLLAVNQKTAQGTSLAMLLPPIGILGVMNYYKAGYVDFKLAGILIVAFLAGSYFGSKIALDIPDTILKRIFGVFLLIVAFKYIFSAK